jgi:hypothetical protein
MPSAYDDAVVTLYQAPLDQFVAERKRLAAELKAAGDKDNASRLAKLGRPTVSAWAVNQLWWRERDAFDALLAAAERMRLGDLAASREHRDALAALRTRAASVLADGGHGAPDGTLRRVTTTLSALAANGGFDPDPPGAIAADRDPPGFGAVGFEALSAPPPPKPAAKAPELKSAPRATAAKAAADAEARRLEEDTRRAQQAERAAAERQRAAEEQRRVERERIKQQAERQRLENALRLAQRELDAHTRELERLERDLAKARAAHEPARAAVKELEHKLAALGSDDAPSA